MKTKRLAALAAQPLVHSLDVIPQYVTVSSQPLGWQGLTVWHNQSPPKEIDVPPLTTHTVFLVLNSGPRLIQQRDGRHTDGPWHTWDIQIARAEAASYWRTEGAVENLHIDLEPRFLEYVALEACGMDPARVELQHVFEAQDPVIKHIGLALWAELKTAGPGGPLYVASLANVLAIHLLRTYCASAPVLRHSTGGLPKHKLRLVLAYITDHLTQQMPLADLAALVQMAPFYFLRTFRQSTGLTPHQYVMQCRIERAQALLQEPTVSITEVALRVGFQTPSHFTMLFRRHTGVTPRAYRTAQGIRHPLLVAMSSGGCPQW